MKRQNRQKASDLTHLAVGRPSGPSDIPMVSDGSDAPAVILPSGWFKMFNSLPGLFNYFVQPDEKASAGCTASHSAGVFFKGAY